MRALVTGATGFVGRRLIEQLERPVVLSRNAQRAKEQLGDVEAFTWNTTEQPSSAAFEGVDTVFHFAGEPMAQGRWTAAKKRRILDSRVDTTRRVVEAMASRRERPSVLVSASAVGWYGNRGDEVLDESSTPGDDFLAQVCKAWEAEALKASDLGIRVVLLRIGLVLGSGGGAIAKMLPVFRLGLGGRLGHGRQWMPWIHLDDVVQLALMGAENQALRGPMNAVTPSVVTNTEFTQTLARALNRKAILPTPALGLRVVLGEFATAFLASQRVTPRVALDAGISFRYPRLDVALRSIVATG